MELPLRTSPEPGLQSHRFLRDDSVSMARVGSLARSRLMYSMQESTLLLQTTIDIESSSSITVHTSL